MTLCEWVIFEPLIRCKYRSEFYVSPQTMPTGYDATFVYNICKETCGVCGDVTIAQTPTSLPKRGSTHQPVTGSLTSNPSGSSFSFPPVIKDPPMCNDTLVVISSACNKVLMFCNLITLNKSLMCQASIKEAFKDYAEFDFKNSIIPTMALGDTYVYNICKSTCNACTSTGPFLDNPLLGP